MMAVCALLATAPRIATADGNTLYASRCASCHGAKGHADTPVARALGIQTFEGSHFTAEAVAKILREGGAHASIDWSEIEPDLEALVATLNTLAEMAE
jgi:mono/diheme cytochrome c family protein